MTSIEKIVRDSYRFFRPPPKLTLSEWAEHYGYLPAESSAEPGKWHNIPYQVGIMDAITDPRIERVTVMKSARVGYTKIIGHCIGFYIHHDPCPIMVVQPTEGDAEGYSKEEIAPLIRDTPVLRSLISESKTRDSGNTILQKQFPGGTLSLVGANSPRGFRRVSRRVVIFDEVDGYPPSAGSEGDQIKLGIRRTEYYWNRKIIAGSTPTVTGLSRIEPMFEDSDKRRYFVPCPHCQEFQVLSFPNLKWPEGKPLQAYFECVHCEKAIEHKHKKEMVEKGRWVGERECAGHAGFHIWAAYSYSPNATWGHIASEFLMAKREGPEALKTFINTVLGETWKEKGDAPEWERIFERREHYKWNQVPKEGLIITAGVDVQKDRLECEVVAWGKDKQSWSLDYRVIPGDTSEDFPWKELFASLLNEQFSCDDGSLMPIRMIAVDSGYNTQIVYNQVRKFPINRVIAVKGKDFAATLISAPQAVDVDWRGKKIRRGVKVWSVGTNLIKTELYGWLRLPKPTAEGEPYPAGYCHFPEYDEHFFKMLTAEQLVIRTTKGGGRRYEWEKIRERNEALDCRIYARAAAALSGLDRFTKDQWQVLKNQRSIEIGKTRPQNPSQDHQKKRKVSPFLKQDRSFW
ncbi:MAG: phage terminase large subunit family protein [Deltaproteobacteria bacterium]|nr:phage terminase large subunit family protein [Deltaproteobacteria bacterium]